ncbi:MAG: polymer-forming cytoskeletal protein [Acetatifactor sp.]|nr:polymer-forming cytoskeletal protein [Acetatifactor sp.]
MKKNKELIITTLIGRDAECNGDFSAKGSARVDGCINGNVTVTGTLIVGVTGNINGDITAQSTIIGGEVIGNVTSAERTELTQTARLIGDITTEIIVIDEKAIFQGGCNMNQESTGKRPKPAARAVRAGRKTAKEAIAEALKEVEEASREGVVEEPEDMQASGQSGTGVI